MLENRGPHPSLTVHLMGGLGNQLFQYAFGRRLALVNGANLWLDAKGYQERPAPSQNTNWRACELGDFNIQAKIAYSTDVADKSVMRRRIHKVLRLGSRLVEKRKPYYDRGEIVEPTRNAFRFDPAVANRKFTGSLSIRGFWQSERYFRDIESILRKDLSWRVEPPSTARDLAAELRASSSVAVHVRHGDNAAPTAALGVLPHGYYDTAMRAISEEISKPAFFVFSDDITWARRFLGTGPQLVYLSDGNSGRGSTDLFLMASCRHHITANSTFSWWGAWLGKKEGQIVYAPRRYYQNLDRPNPDLYPQGWRLL